MRGRGHPGRVVALVPAKPLRLAKARLAPVLAAAARASLAAAMLEDVLQALASEPRICGTAVVTGDPEAGRLARRHGARVLADPPGGGYREAAAHGLAALAAMGVDAALVLPADVPLAGADEIAALIDLARDRAVALVPAASDGGTNALLLRPPSILAPAFGPDSLRRHVDAARRAGIEPLVSEMVGIGLDIDRPADLDALLAHPSAGRTRSGRLLARAWAPVRVPERV